MEKDKAVGAQIRKLRLAHALTQQELAEAVGVSTESLSRAERGAILPTVRTLGRIAEALDTTIDALAGRPAGGALGAIKQSDSQSPELKRIVRLLHRLDRRSLRRLLAVVELIPAGKPRSSARQTPKD